MGNDQSIITDTEVAAAALNGTVSTVEITADRLRQDARNHQGAIAIQSVTQEEYLEHQKGRAHNKGRHSRPIKVTASNVFSDGQEASGAHYYDSSASAFNVFSSYAPQSAFQNAINKRPGTGSTEMKWWPWRGPKGES